MELYLDSVDFKEIEEAFKLGFLKGLTTTPTFMHRQGITDIDGAIVKLSAMVPELQIEALGQTHDEIVAEAHRLLKLPLKRKPVFKIPVSLEGVRACRTLTDEGNRVNVHLVYTLNQAYLAMAAGAAYVCPLAGRLQDQGHDAIQLFEQCVEIARKYRFPTKIMFSSVRYPEHVRQALLAGVDVCTLPWTVLKRLCDNELTAVGTTQFLEHTRLVGTRVREVIRKENPVCRLGDTVVQALVKMTESKLGAVALVDDKGQLAGIFTDGDVRRRLQENGQRVLDKKLSELKVTAKPVTITADAPLSDAVNLLNKHQVDNIIVLENNVPIGMLDVQDLVKLGLVG
ncbi:MAG TPA: transaldolase family protein [Planctomycetota bacterium]|nr:transaldolase family protein [Planctomycetota bacterium]